MHASSLQIGVAQRFATTTTLGADSRCTDGQSSCYGLQFSLPGAAFGVIPKRVAPGESSTLLPILTVGGRCQDRIIFRRGNARASEGSTELLFISSNLRRGTRGLRQSKKNKFPGGKKYRQMELFAPQLMDPMPFRFLSEYHAKPMRAVKDSVTPICFFGFGQPKPVIEVVQAGDPVLHEAAAEVRVEDIRSARIEKIINDMVATMRNAPGVGLAAPQIGVNLQIIVLEDTEELITYSSPEECEDQQRYPFDLQVIINPKLKTRSGCGRAVFFEGCLSVEGYRALVERDLEVEVTGLGRDGLPIRVEASGWKARILQHECDHLAGVLYVDKMVPRTFRTKENLRLPLPAGCPAPGICKHSVKSLKG